MIELLAVAASFTATLAALLFALAVLAPIFVLAAEILSALLPLEKMPRAAAARRPRVAVLVPAHDEAAGIAATLTNICSQLAAGDRLLVVADNCSDATALVARSAGREPDCPAAAMARTALAASPRACILMSSE